LKKVDLYDGSHFVRLALQMMALVFVRTGELIPAQWLEFDRREKLWNTPPSPGTRYVNNTGMIAWTAVNH